MISRTSLRYIVVLAAFMGPLYSFGQTGRVVRLDDFVKGVSIPAQTRFKVGDVTVGKTSVKSLFEISLPSDPSTLEYYAGKRGNVTLRIKSPAHLAQLNQIIALQPGRNAANDKDGSRHRRMDIELTIKAAKEMK